MNGQRILWFAGLSEAAYLVKGKGSSTMTEPMAPHRTASTIPPLQPTAPPSPRQDHRQPHGLNVPMVGVILILAGAVGLLLPRLVRALRDRLRRWAYSAKPQADDKPPTAEDPGVHNYRPILSEDLFTYENYPTPADDLLRDEHDPPLVENLPGYENPPLP
jgi:hypothetical protein